VDDIIIISDDEREESQVIQGLKNQYTIQDLGTLKHYLGITVEGLDDSVIVHQRRMQSASSKNLPISSRRDAELAVEMVSHLKRR
jgi:hypothetical protein